MDSTLPRVVKSWDMHIRQVSKGGGEKAEETRTLIRLCGGGGGVGGVSGRRLENWMGERHWRSER
jgi:hypothetical protein